MYKFLLLLVLGYLVYASAFYLIQRTLLFPIKHVVMHPLNESDFPLLQKHQLTLPFGEVDMWFLPPTSDRATVNGQYPVAIVGHGNGNVIDNWPARLGGLRELGVGALLVEYPGYGRSAGEPSQASITAAMAEGLKWLRGQTQVDQQRTILIGRSLGGGAVLTLMPEVQPAAIVLMSTFTSVRTFASRYGLPAFLTRDPFDNLAALSDYDGPVFMIHGRHDQVVPFAESRKLHKALLQSQMVEYDCNHSDCPPDWEEFWGRIEQFLAENQVIPGRP